MSGDSALLEWARRKRLRAWQAYMKNEGDENLKLIWEYWREIVRAVHIMEDLNMPHGMRVRSAMFITEAEAKKCKKQEK